MSIDVVFKSLSIIMTFSFLINSIGDFLWLSTTERISIICESSFSEMLYLLEHLFLNVSKFILGSCIAEFVSRCNHIEEWHLLGLI